MPPKISASAVMVCLLLVLTAAGVASAVENNDIIYELSDAEYYRMPAMFRLDDAERCGALGGTYCVGSFELTPATVPHTLYDTMQRYSLDWVNNFNHTRLHRGLCLPQSCADHRPPAPHPPHHQLTYKDLENWFSRCVNASTSSEYGLYARPMRVEYCTTGAEGAHAQTSTPPLTAAERGFAAMLAVLLALSALSTALDLTLADHARKGTCWSVALSFSVRGSWRALHAPLSGGTGGGSGGSSDGGMRALDGLRVLCMMCVIGEHVCWLTTQTYVANTREYETMRRATDVMLMVNSTLVVQIFFLMSSFLLAHKLLQQQRRGVHIAPVSTFLDTMFNRIVRVSPSYWVVVWFASGWWSRVGGGGGPLWAPLVGAEVDVCRRKWWTHLLYLNNVIYPDDKCLIQTWYLAADMQLYGVSLALTLMLSRVRRARAVAVLTALLVGTVTIIFTLAYIWHLIPTYAMHSPELVRASYSGDSSFNVLYQSPLSNSPGALAGLLLAHVHHALLDARIDLSQYKMFRWISVISPPLAVWWAASSPLLLGAGPPSRGPAAALAAVERPIFSMFVALGLLGAMHDVKSPLRTLLSWRMWAAPARLSFGVLLLHLPLNKSLVAARQVPSQLTRQIAIFEWMGVALVSFACAVPLALLVEYPAQRVMRALRPRRSRPPAPPAAVTTSPPATTVSQTQHEKTDAD